MSSVKQASSTRFINSAEAGAISEGRTITWLPADSAPTSGDSVSSNW